MTLARTFIALLFSSIVFLAPGFGVPGMGQSKGNEIDKEALKKAQENKVVRAYQLTEPFNLDGRLSEAVYQNPAI